MALPALVLAGIAVLVVRFATSEYPLGGAPEEVPCAEALAFGGAKPPAGAYDAECAVQSWLDTNYEARFRMPRKDVRAWLETTYPVAPEPRTDHCYPDSVDLCLHLEFQAGTEDYAGLFPGLSDPGFGAYAADVDVTYEGPDRALVRFSAFTT
ncbi:hypothetical protein [Streptomyces cinerochromogenes]|uniref:hypothetical protein n=1 Tax=Streptomyces cinerochromogenes TaxID=66422 RepID=UPI001670548C|nr:hypothetical protein [Streptomyces cinerochromogenes]